MNESTDSVTMTGWVNILSLLNYIASLTAQLVKNRPAMQETLVRFLDGKDPLKKEMATHSSNLAWRIPTACSSFSQ